jgi:hypothetical protein
MRQKQQVADLQQAEEPRELDIVVPFTTPELTRAALREAGRLGAGLHAKIRLLRIEIIPFPLDPHYPPVDPGFLRKQMETFQATLPLERKVLLARDFKPELCSRLREESIVVLASRRRLWRTRSERLAASLRDAGRDVVMVYEENNNA